MTGNRPHRSGYALIMVLVFMVLFAAIVGVAFRRLGSAIRTESAHAIQLRRDAGSLQALAKGLSLLETGLPSENPYVCGTTIDTPDGPRTFTVTFTQEEGTSFSVRAAPSLPDEVLTPMPDNFFTVP